MRHILKFKIFESTEIDHEIAEKIEQCKDIIETFNELGEKFIITNYKQGYFHNPYSHTPDIDIMSGGKFETTPLSENDKIALKFYLGLQKDFQDNYFKSLSSSIKTEELDEVVEIVNKSKFFLSKFKKYCDSIKCKIEDKKISFILVFDNPDSNSKKVAKIDRVNKELKYYLFQTGGSKTFQLVQNTRPETKYSERYKDFWELFKNNPGLVVDGEAWTPNNNNLELRFSPVITTNSDIISIKIESFKWKSYLMRRVKSIKLSNDELKEVMKLIYDRLSKKIKAEEENITGKIEGNKITFKIN